MAELKLVNNPFNPGTATRPAYLAGRHKELKLIEETLVKIAELRKRRKKSSPSPAPMAPIKIVGPRGVGKTILLAEAQKMAEEMKIHVLDIVQFFNLNGPGLVRDLIGEKAYDRLLEELLQREGISAGPRGLILDIDLPQLFREKMEKKPVLLLMDEVMHYDPQALEGLMHMCQHLIGEDLPLAVIMAGTQQLDPHLEQLPASLLDGINDVYINDLSDEETLEALGKPFERDEVKVEPAALRRMAELTDNYPYFTQLVGEFVWDAMMASGKRKVSMALVQKIEPEIQQSLEDFHDQVYMKIIGKDLMGHANRVMEILRQNQGKAKRGTIISGLRNKDLDNGEKKLDIFYQLKDLDFIWEHEGGVEAAHPSFFDYWRKRAEEVQKAIRANQATASQSRKC